MSSELDVLALIDEIDDVIHNAKPVPLTDQVRVDKERIYELLDELRAGVATEILRARAAAEGAPAPREGEPEAALTGIEVDQAARELKALCERAKFGGERFRIESHGMAMAELGPTP